MTDYIYINPQHTELIRKYNLRSYEAIRTLPSEPVSTHKRREVRKVILEGMPLYIRKESPNLKEFFSYLKRYKRSLSPATYSFYAYYKLKEYSIEAPEPICAVEKRILGIPRKVVIIQKSIEGISLYEKLREFGYPWRDINDCTERYKLLYQLGEFLNTLKKARINWPDLVAKHIFVRFDQSSGNWKFGIIDIDRLSFNFSKKRWKRQIKTMLHTLKPLLKPTDILRIAIGYLGLYKLPNSITKAVVEKELPQIKEYIQDACKEMRLLRYFYPKDHTLAEEIQFKRIGSLVINTRYKEILEHLKINNSEALFSFSRGTELAKASLRGRKRFRFDINWQGKCIWLYLKKTDLPPIKEQISRILNGALSKSSSWYEYHMIKTLNRYRIPTPHVIAYAEKMLGPIELKSAILTEGLIGQSLETFVPKIFARTKKTIKPDTLYLRRRWIRKLAELIRHFHESGFCHRDLYLSHIFISFPEGETEPIFYLIDLARCFKTGLRKKRWIIKDLASLNYSTPPIIKNTDRIRFIKTYLSINKLDKPTKKLIKKILKKTYRITKHNQKHREKYITQER